MTTYTTPVTFTASADELKQAARANIVEGLDEFIDAYLEGFDAAIDKVLHDDEFRLGTWRPDRVEFLRRSTQAVHAAALASGRASMVLYGRADAYKALAAAVGA